VQKQAFIDTVLNLVIAGLQVGFLVSMVWVTRLPELRRMTVILLSSSGMFALVEAVTVRSRSLA